MVEKASDGTYYFCVHDLPAQPERNSEERAPRRLAVFWDASGSRAGSDHKREIAVLDQCLTHWSTLCEQDVVVDLILLRNRSEDALSFKVRQNA